MGLLQRILDCLLNQRYEMTLHAKEEMEADDLTPSDIKMAILRGRISKKYTKDARGTRHELEGPSEEGDKIRVVGRFTSRGEFRIITVFKVNS